MQAHDEREVKKSFTKQCLKSDCDACGPTSQRLAALPQMYSLLSNYWLGHSAIGKISPPQNAVHLKPHVCLQATPECQKFLFFLNKAHFFPKKTPTEVRNHFFSV